MQLQFSQFKPQEEIQEQRALWRDAFPETIGTPLETEQFYRWKFHGSLQSHEYIARLPDGKLAGYYAAIKFPYIHKGKPVSVGMVCDVMTSSAARGKGVFTKLGAYALGEMATEGVAMTMGYPIRPEVIPGHIKVGWSISALLPVYIKVVDSKDILKNFGIPWLSAPVNLGLAVVKGLMRATQRQANDITIRQYTKDQLDQCSWIDELSSKWLEQVSFGLRKDRNFLKWRLGAPKTEYVILGAFDQNGIPIGICIARTTQLHGISTVAIMDSYATCRHKEVFSLLDKQLEDIAKKERCAVVAGMYNPSWARQLGLRRRGYLCSNHKFKLITKNLGTANSDIDTSHAPLMWIDSDDL